MGRHVKRLKIGETVNGFEVMEELPPRKYDGRILREYKGKCLRCGAISIKTRQGFIHNGCRKCCKTKDKNLEVQMAKRLTREQIERLNNAPYIMEGLLTLRDGIIMQAAVDTRAKDREIQEAAWRFFESDMFKSLCIDLDYEIVIQEIKKAKRFRQRRA